MHESDIDLLTNSDRMTRLRDGWWKNRGSNPGSHDSFFIFPKAPTPVMRPSLPSLQRVPGSLYPGRSGQGLKFAKRESSAEVKSYVELCLHSSIF